MRTGFSILTISLLLLFSASSLVAQVGKQTGLPKPNGPANKTPIPNKPPASPQQLPDLIIRSANRIEPLSSKVMIRVANIGKADAGYFEVSYVCDWYPKESGKPFFLAGAVIAVESLAAGELKPFEVDCGKHALMATKLKFGASVDWSSKVKESNEKNNAYSTPNLK